jgi:tetratricopeptide (TPR) repeat protein
VALRKGALREALKESTMALELLQKDPDPRSIGQLFLDVASIFAHMGGEVRQEARTWLDRGVEKLSALGDWGEVSRGYALLGELISETRPQEGLEFLLKSREFAEQAHEPRWLARTLLRTVPLRVALGEVEVAERENQEALRLLERNDDPVGRILFEMNQGLFAERRGEDGTAPRQYETAQELADHFHQPEEAAECHFRLARLFLLRGDWKRSAEQFNRSKRLEYATLRPGAARRFREFEREIDRLRKAAAPSG